MTICNILVLCTGNSARSIMAEALFNGLGAGRVHARSAGSRPAGKVNPWALEQLKASGYPTGHLRSKSWEEFARPESPPMDVVITVCGNAAGEACPVWPGAPVSAHWGIADPAAVDGSDEEKCGAFEIAFRQLETRVRRFLELPLGNLDRSALQRELDAIGRSADEEGR